MPQGSSPAEYLASLPESKRASYINGLSEETKAALLYEWKFWARPEQLPPTGDWDIWVYLAGRGTGKTRAGAEWARSQAESIPGSHGALVAATPGDARDVMVEGESGILSVCPPWDIPFYEPAKRRLTWKNGSAAHIYSAFDPVHLRGPQFHWAWADELASWKKLKTDPTGRKDNPWDMLMFGLRLGEKPRCVVSTTPKPIELIRELLRDPRCAITRGSTYDNIANLAPSFVELLLSKYEGTTLGRQEINAELLEEIEGALWTQKTLESCRRTEYPEMVRIVTAVDPTGGVAEAGIVTAGIGTDGHGYVLDDSSLRGSPDEWARAAITDYNKFKADRIIAEANFGGEMVEHTIRMTAEKLKQSVSYKDVHASRGKQIRAEPVAALYEQGRVHHVGVFPQLEGELTSWVPGEASPNRLDALVWAITELIVDAPGIGIHIDAPESSLERAKRKGIVQTHGGRDVRECARAGCERCREFLKL